MDIFSFINGDSNDILSKMNNTDKEQLLELLKQYKIELRDKLNLDNNVTFGLELEFNSGKPKVIESNIKTFNYRWLIEKRLHNSYWEFKKETSSPAGYEITSPILVDNEENYRQLKEICNMLKDEYVLITNKDAGHIHFGTQIIGNSLEDWLKFFKLYTLYENIIYRFGYGEYENKRDFLPNYASPLADKYYQNLKILDSRHDSMSLRRLFDIMKTTYKKEALSLYKVADGGTSFEKNRTIEFRMPNASIEPIIWQNNINFFAHLLSASKKDIDTDLLMKKIEDKKYTLDDYDYYNVINVDEALELADIIFDNNLDKINFLRQYMKNFEINYRYDKSKPFIKR